jgi:GR25 family glycosyltransferase involved in LPS biosynthesis
MRRPFIIFLIFLILVTVWINYITDKENYENAEKHIEFYVISMKKENRLANIQNQLDKINSGKSDQNKLVINVVDAIVGVDLNQKELIDKKILSDKFDGNGSPESRERKSVIGCYMSHCKIYNLIKERNQPGYSVYFEDDFNIVDNDFLNKVQNAVEILKDHDFDIMYLGTNHNNHGENIKDYVYKINKGGSLYGAHAILINNKKIDKIIEHTKFITFPIDVRLEQLCRSDELIGTVIYPHLVFQQFDKLDSTITVGGFTLMENQLTFSPVSE